MRNGVPEIVTGDSPEPGLPDSDWLQRKLSESGSFGVFEKILAFRKK